MQRGQWEAVALHDRDGAFLADPTILILDEATSPRPTPGPEVPDSRRR